MEERNTRNTIVKKGIEEVMPFGEEFGRAQIKEMLLKEKGLTYGRDYSEGNIASALRVLSSTGILRKTARGVYQKADDERNKYDERTKNSDEEMRKKNEKRKERHQKQDVREITELLEENKKRLKMMFDEVCLVLKKVDLSGEMTDAEFDEVKNAMSYKNALTELLKKLEE